MTKKVAAKWAVLLWGACTWDGNAHIPSLPYGVRVSLFRSRGFKTAAKWFRELADALEEK